MYIDEGRKQSILSWETITYNCAYMINLTEEIREITKHAIQVFKKTNWDSIELYVKMEVCETEDWGGNDSRR